MKTYKDLEKSFNTILSFAKELTELNKVPDLELSFSSFEKKVIFHGKDWDKVEIFWDGIYCQFDNSQDECFFEKQKVIEFLQTSKTFEEFSDNMNSITL